jgi:AraC-like DNA-binding protein
MPRSQLLTDVDEISIFAATSFCNQCNSKRCFLFVHLTSVAVTELADSISSAVEIDDVAGKFEKDKVRETAVCCLYWVLASVIKHNAIEKWEKDCMRLTKSVVEIALDVGYANPSHFAQLFRRESGLSPSDYRQQR